MTTVVGRTDRLVTFIGEDRDGTFTHGQIDRLFDDGRLEIVLDDETHSSDGRSK